MMTLARIPVLRRLWPALVLIAALFPIALGFSFASATLQRIVTSMIINLVGVVGMYVFVGNSGIFSFGHVGFMGIGAYAAGLLSLSVKNKAALFPDMPSVVAGISLPSLVAILIGGLVAVLFALIMTLPLMRMRAIALPIGTFAMLVIVHTVTIGWRSLTGGVGTLMGLRLDTTLWLAFGFAALAMLVAVLFQTSRAGMRLKACREDEVAARAAGIGVLRERTWAWLISAYIMGVAGGLYAHQLGMLHPDAFWFSTTILLTVMLIVGGMRSLAGAFVGTVGISIISELLRRVEQAASRPGLKELVFAAILVGVLIWRRQGIMGNREFELPRPRGGRREPVGPPDQELSPETETE